MTGLLGSLLAAASVVALVAGARSAVAAGARAPRGRVGRELLAHAPGGRALILRIHRAGLSVDPAVLVACAVGVSLLSAAALLIVLRRPVTALPGLLVGVVALRLILDAADRRHLRRVGEAMPSVAQMLASAVAAGLSLRQAITRAARDTPDPLGAELRRASGEMELGARVDDALTGLARRLPDPDLGLLVTAILVQRRTGGDLARALRDMAQRLEERGRLARELRGATVQARATAWMVAALPLVGAALAEAASPGLLARAASTPLGAAIVATSVALQVLGILVIRRIATVTP